MEKISFMTDAQYIDTCNAIREKGGSTGLIKSGELAAKIRAIPTGTISKSMLIITAPTGSTVTASNGTVTKTAAEDKGTWTFTDLDIGTWSVTAKLLDNEKTITVEISRLTIEYRTISYGVYLYQKGVSNTALIGSWINHRDGGTVDFRPEYIHLGENPTKWTVIGTEKSLDLAKYKTVKVSILRGSFEAGTKNRLVVADKYDFNKFTGADPGPNVQITSAPGIFSLDISEIPSGMIFLQAAAYGDFYDIEEIWVE